MDSAIATTVRTLSPKITLSGNTTGQLPSHLCIPPCDAFDKEWHSRISCFELTPSKSETTVDSAMNNAIHDAVSEPPNHAMSGGEGLDGTKESSELALVLGISLPKSLLGRDPLNCDLAKAHETKCVASLDRGSGEKRDGHLPDSEDQRLCARTDAIGSLLNPDQALAQIISIDHDVFAASSGMTATDSLQPPLAKPASIKSPSQVPCTDLRAVLETPEGQTPPTISAFGVGTDSTTSKDTSSSAAVITPKPLTHTAASKNPSASPTAPRLESILPPSLTSFHQDGRCISGLSLQIHSEIQPPSKSNAVESKIIAPQVEVSGMIGDHSALSASPKLDVGVFNPVHGWLHIRAESDGSGNISASLTAASAAAHDSLRAQLPELVNYLVSEQVNVSRLAVHQSAPVEHGLTANTQGQSDGNPAHQHEGGRESDLERDACSDHEFAAEHTGGDKIRQWFGGMARVTAELTWSIGMAGRRHGGWVNVCA